MIHNGIEFDEDVLAGRKQPTIEQLKYLAFKYVKEWNAIRRKCEEEIDFQQSIIRVADTHPDIISKDSYLSRQFERHRKMALREIEEHEKLLEQLKEIHTDVLGTAQWARRQLKGK